VHSWACNGGVWRAKRGRACRGGKVGLPPKTALSLTAVHSAQARLTPIGQRARARLGSPSSASPPQLSPRRPRSITAPRLPTRSKPSSWTSVGAEELVNHRTDPRLLQQEVDQLERGISQMVSELLLERCGELTLDLLLDRPISSPASTAAEPICEERILERAGELYTCSPRTLPKLTLVSLAANVLPLSQRLRISSRRVAVFRCDTSRPMKSEMHSHPGLLHRGTAEFAKIQSLLSSSSLACQNTPAASSSATSVASSSSTRLVSVVASKNSSSYDNIEARVDLRSVGRRA
jgi:hypothetical protein